MKTSRWFLELWLPVLSRSQRALWPRWHLLPPYNSELLTLRDNGSCPGFLQWGTTLWKCKPDEPSPPLLAFGHGSNKSPNINWYQECASTDRVFGRIVELRARQVIECWDLSEAFLLECRQRRPGLGGFRGKFESLLMTLSGFLAILS